MLLIVDIDGTVADWTKRAKRAGIQPDRENKKAFQEWLDELQSEKSLAKDEPISQVINLVNGMYAEGYKIVFLTGRSELYRRVTTNWLLRYTDVVSPVVVMRGQNDWRSAAGYKEAALKNILKEHKGEVLAIDDDYDGDVTHVYSKLGIVHLKVMA